MNKKLPLISLTVLSLIYSCATPITNNTGNNTNTSFNQVNINTPITGKVEFPQINKLNPNQSLGNRVEKKAGLSVKATVTDIGTNATVSLIYPSDYSDVSKRNQTIASGVTNSSGAFTINPNFTANTGDIFVLEANRRIGSTGNFLMSVRTFVKWTGSSWTSITTGGVAINSKTTALVAMTGLLSPSVSSDDTIGTITGTTPTDIKHNGTGAVIINASSITSTADLVVTALANNQDPTSYLTYSNGQFTLQEPTPFINTIYTIAGTGTGAYLGDNGQATAAQIYNPSGITVDSSGNIYFADKGNSRIRKIGTNGVITTIAGTGNLGSTGDNGQATDAGIYNPEGISVDNSGNIYFADSYNHKIRKINTSGVITNVAGTGSPGNAVDGGQATDSPLKYPTGVKVDSSNNIYISDRANHRIRKVSPSGVITTIAGNGTAGFSGDNGQATNAQINFPYGITVDSSGNVYIADNINNRIRKVNTSGVITTVAGTGTQGYSGDGGQATAAQINQPQTVEVDSDGNLYIADYNNNRIRKVNTSGVITTISGTGSPGYSGDGGQATNAQIYSPNGIAIDSSANIYFSDYSNNRIRKINVIKPISP